MRKLIIPCAVSFLVCCWSCGSSDNNDKNTQSSTEQPQKNPEAQKGLALVAKSDCLTCHQIVEKGIGPSYTAIAERYPNNGAVIDSLSNKILQGGAGNWGSIYMNAHPDLSKEDAELMVKYVLSLKNQ